VVIPTSVPHPLAAVLTSAAASGTSSNSAAWAAIIIPIIILLLLFWFAGRRARQAGGGSGPGGGGAGGFGALSRVGKSRAQVYDTTRPSTRFRDVAGYEAVKRDVSEIVDYLRRPERYRRVGAVGPKGVLMVGPPGTGKTLIARALAGEADVPFISVSASSFVEMFVGVGASRVRDLFSEARKRAPAIIFIDEIDAVGQKRSVGGGGVQGGHSEREQTLQQMFTEMDGFEPNSGLVVLAATNRPEILDQALLRPGRFDRHVQVPLPNRRERRAILQVHSRGKKLAGDIDLDIIAAMTPGFSGADLANLLNEGAIQTVRDDRLEITQADLIAARDRILLGQRDESNVLLPDEKHAVAAHEGGHALVAALSEHADPVVKVTILPAGRALGATEQLPEDDRHLRFEDYLRDTLAVRLGGRAAELLMFGQGSTGAANDLTNATRLATKMVREFGMSTAIGPIGFASDSPGYLGDDGLAGRPYAEATQRRIDDEVARLLREAEDRAVALLRSHRPALEKLMDRLVEDETVDGKVVESIARETPPLASEPEPGELPAPGGNDGRIRLGTALREHPGPDAVPRLGPA
jgi:cell division protease FtsH